jgi:hypothetical protein
VTCDYGLSITCNTCAGAPLYLLLVLLQGKDARAERVRQLLLDSPSFERGLMPMVDSWQDVLHCSATVSLMAAGLKQGYLLRTSLATGWHLSDTLSAPGWHLSDTWLAPAWGLHCCCFHTSGAVPASQVSLKTLARMTPGRLLGSCVAPAPHLPDTCVSPRVLHSGVVSMMFQLGGFAVT